MWSFLAEKGKGLVDVYRDGVKDFTENLADDTTNAIETIEKRRKEQEGSSSSAWATLGDAVQATVKTVSTLVSPVAQPRKREGEDNEGMEPMRGRLYSARAARIEEFVAAEKGFWLSIAEIEIEEKRKKEILCKVVNGISDERETGEWDENDDTESKDQCMENGEEEEEKQETPNKETDCTSLSNTDWVNVENDDLEVSGEANNNVIVNTSISVLNESNTSDILASVNSTSVPHSEDAGNLAVKIEQALNDKEEWEDWE